MSIGKHKFYIYTFLSLITMVIYIICMLWYLKDETVSLVKVAPLYTLLFIFIILSYCFLKEITCKRQIFFWGLVIFFVQLSLGFFYTLKWMEPRSDYLINNQLWLKHLRILGTIHFVGGVTPFIRIIFNRI